MPAANSAPGKLPIRWLAAAQRAAEKSLNHIAAQDPNASALVYKRLLGALDVIALQPAIGTPTRQEHIKRCPIPRTGHTIEYRLTASEIVITRWIRQVRLRKP